MTLEVTPISRLPAIKCRKTSMSNIPDISLSRIKTAHCAPRSTLQAQFLKPCPGGRLGEITVDRPLYWSGFFWICIRRRFCSVRVIYRVRRTELCTSDCGGPLNESREGLSDVIVRT